MEDKTKQPTENIINVHPSNDKAVKEFFDKKISASTESESVPSAEEYLSKSGLHAEGKLKVDICKMLNGFASLSVEQKTKRIKEDVMITLSEVLDHSHIFESEYQTLRKKILQIFES